MEFGNNFSYISDLMTLAGGGNVRRRLEEKHLTVLIEAIEQQVARLKGSEILRSPTVEELTYGAKSLLYLQKLWEKKWEKDEKRNFKRVIEIHGAKNVPNKKGGRAS